MRKAFELKIVYKNHAFEVDGFTQYGRVHFNHIYLEGTNIEISDSLTVNQHNELTDLILELCTAQ